jgi:glutathione synthase/RimK-type ligase-like ATP-grasp enzyme
MMLVITHRRGFEADFVIDTLRNRNAPVCRFNYDEYPVEAGLTMLWRGETTKAAITRRSTLTPVEDIRVAWFHRPGAFQYHPALTDPAIRIAEGETAMAVSGFWECAPWVWVQHPAAVARAANKLSQLVVAQRLGFVIPRTLVTNSVEQATAFLDQCDNQVIIKDMDTQFIDIQGITHMSWTKPITKEELRSAGIPGSIPICIQEYVPKEVELRVTVVNGQVFPVAIDSQSTPETQHDYRRGSLGSAEHVTAAELPENIVKQCIALVHHFGLDYGAIDMILNPDGAYVFLELNTAGAWVWAERLTGLPITDALADLIVRRHATADRPAPTPGK